MLLYGVQPFSTSTYGMCKPDFSASIVYQAMMRVTRKINVILSVHATKIITDLVYGNKASTFAIKQPFIMMLVLFYSIYSLFIYQLPPAALLAC